MASLESWLTPATQMLWPRQWSRCGPGTSRCEKQSAGGLGTEWHNCILVWPCQSWFISTKAWSGVSAKTKKIGRHRCTVKGRRPDEGESMKILQLCATDTKGGASKVAFELSRGL